MALLWVGTRPTIGGGQVEHADTSHLQGQHSTTFDIFAGHCTVAANFDISLAAKSHLAWPLPTKIPWEEIQIPQWHATSQPFHHFTPGMDPTELYCQFSQHFEDSIGPHYNNGSSRGLPRSCTGRGQRTTPSTRHTTPPSCRNDLPGQAVLRWYRQLRRLQSFLHAARASSQTPTAQQYRAELWASIRRASGFNTNFTSWWSQQDHARHIGQLPVGPLLRRLAPPPTQPDPEQQKCHHLRSGGPLQVHPRPP